MHSKFYYNEIVRNRLTLRDEIVHPVGEDLGGQLGESRVDPALLGHRTRDGGKAGRIGLVGNELSPICPPGDCLINLRQAVAKLTVAIMD